MSTSQDQLKNWKLKKPCADCEKERKNWGEEFCFEHEWDNPYKLTQDRQELEEYWKSQKSTWNWGFFWLIFGIISNLLKSLICFSKGWVWLFIVLNGLPLLLWVYVLIYWIKEFKKEKNQFVKESKEIKTKQEQWVKK